MNSQKGGAAAFAATRITLRPFDQALDLARSVLDADAAVPGVSLERECHVVRQPALNLLAPLAAGEEIADDLLLDLAATNHRPYRRAVARDGESF